MENKILKKSNLTKFSEAIMKKYVLYAPIIKNEIPQFRMISDPKNISLDFQNTIMSAKEILFKQTETMYCYTMGSDVQITPSEPSEKSVILGIRPCDAKSLSVLDEIFTKDIIDPYYTARRENTTLIGLACNEPGLNCFCTSVKGSPTGTDNIDILLTDLGDKYLVEVLTKKGEEIANQTKSLLQNATSADKSAKEKLQKEVLEKFIRSVDVDGVAEKIKELFENEIWEDLARICLGCSICTYMCPTCTCFDVQDECEENVGCRIRVWDNCQNPEYSLHGSGHNPRPARTNRVRHKVGHKFSYLPITANIFGCVGCGRCIENCPENWDIIDAIEKVKKVQVKAD
ncbi:MAG: 4Fe-4S dicluster domain-containing protein [Candidatus Hodarchaeota archaeon]